MYFLFTIIIIYTIVYFVSICNYYYISNMMFNNNTCGSTMSLAIERNNVHSKYNDIISISENIITINNCLPGKEFKHKHNSYDIKDIKDIKCNNCSDNYYRTATNATCLQCPVGYFSKSGDIECTKEETNINNTRSLCNKGYITGNNKFAKYEESCYECNYKNKEYMPYANNYNNCYVCPSGSIVDVKMISCSKCPIGYYEKNNICIQCDIGTYNDIVGSSKCYLCDNKNAIAYNSVGGYNCNNSIFYYLTDTIKNNLFNMDNILKPIAHSANRCVAIINNNRRNIEVLIPNIIILYVAYVCL